MNTHEQIAEAYRRMATEAHYRPAAPGDGVGNIAFPTAELVLEDEARQYAGQWTEEEHTGTFSVGVCNYPTRPATVFAIEAARAMCGAHDDLARDLLRMALAELDDRRPEDV
jgi:hypothetical protein